MLTRIGVLSLLLVFGSCDRSASEPTAPPAATPAASKSIATPEVHHARCGCTLEGVRRCGNYVDIDGSWVTLEWPALGVMEYCELKDAGAQVEITGELTDGRFVASSYRRLD